MVAMTSCGFPSLDPSLDEPAAEDATPSGELVLEGGVFTTGGVVTAQTLDLVDDGLEVADWSCVATFCITGGLQP
jgi:hypothetical protein